MIHLLFKFAGSQLLKVPWLSAPPLARGLTLTLLCWIPLREAPSPHEKLYEIYTQRTQAVNDTCHRGGILVLGPSPHPSQREEG